jgi:hypothetical protein
MTIELSDEQRLDWLRLIRSENVGPARSARSSTSSAGPPRPLRRFRTSPDAAGG